MQETLFENKYFERGLTKKTFKKLTWFFSFALSLFLWTTLKKQKKLGTSHQSLRIAKHDKKISFLVILSPGQFR